MKRMLLGLAVGLAVWAFLRAIGLSHFGLYSYPLWFLITTIFISAALAGYFAGKNGLMLGGIIGLIDLAPLVGLLYAMSALSEFAGAVTIWLMWFGFSVGPGLLGGYLGERLARFRSRRSSPPDCETAEAGGH